MDNMNSYEDLETDTITSQFSLRQLIIMNLLI